MKDYEMGDIGSEGCACGEVKIKDYTIATHCHRSSCDTCNYGGVHYTDNADMNHVKYIQEYLSDGYRGDFEIIKGLRK